MWRKRGGGKYTQRVDKLEDLLKQSDYITLHTPYIKGVTHHLLNSETLAVCKPGVSILNFARGEIVDGSAVKVCVCVVCVREREREGERSSPYSTVWA